VRSSVGVLGELPLVMANGGELNQVFLNLNLIVNASHAIESRVRDTDERGKITARTRVEEAGVVITVSDTGCGIPAEIAGRVFDLFFTPPRRSDAAPGRGSRSPTRSSSSDTTGRSTSSPTRAAAARSASSCR
jgi:signal transduction histidine kinase